MGVFNNVAAYDRALATVQKALESGSIKLIGPTVGELSEKRMAADINYLNSLINGLAENLTDK